MENTPVEVTNPELTAELRTEAYRKKYREEKIQGLREAFIPVKKPVEISSTPWKDGVSERQRPLLFNRICVGLDQFQSMTWALREMDDANGVYNVSWEDIGIQEKGARIIYRMVGIETARYMIEMIHDIPRHVRKHIEPCYRGEGSWNFSNEFDEFENLVEILDAINPTNQELGVNKEDLRDLLIVQLMLHVEELESATQEGYINQDAALDCLTSLAENATKEWGIPMSLLAISPKNVKAVMERRNQSVRGCAEDINLTLMR
ncbi:MAG: hypothetical protein Q8R40_03195 [bacterium]|nr:hypothetical protein [bacterium]